MRKQAPFPPIKDLHKNHPGLTPAICDAFDEAVRVCLSRHHEPPQEIRVAGATDSLREINWVLPTARILRGWANRDDATRDGAYPIAIATVEEEFGHVAVARAETLTGADYYLRPASERSNDLERALRLEVSGTDLGGGAIISKRLGQKLEQLRRGRSDIPGIACVVGFKALRIAVAQMEEGLDVE